MKNDLQEIYKNQTFFKTFISQYSIPIPMFMFICYEEGTYVVNKCIFCGFRGFIIASKFKR